MATTASATRLPFDESLSGAVVQPPASALELASDGVRSHAVDATSPLVVRR